MDGYAAGSMQYYQDDGLGGLGGDDGLGGLGGYAPPPQQPTYGDDGLMYMPMDESEPVNEPRGDNQEELAELLDVGLFGTEPSQAALQPDSNSQLPSRSQRSGDDDDDDDEATDDEQDFDDFDEGGQEQQMVSVEEQQQQEPQPELLDPAAVEAQRQNAWYK